MYPDFVSTENPTVHAHENHTFDFDAAMSNTEDALDLIEATQELLYPLLDNPKPTAEDLYQLTRRARMIDATLRAARDKTQDALALFHASDPVPVSA